jgi:hypothetical protein
MRTACRVREEVFQKPQPIHQTVFCFSYSYFFTAAFPQPTAHSTFFKSHSSTKHIHPTWQHLIFNFLAKKAEKKLTVTAHQISTGFFHHVQILFEENICLSKLTQILNSDILKHRANDDQTNLKNI